MEHNGDFPGKSSGCDMNLFSLLQNFDLIRQKKIG